MRAYGKTEFRLLYLWYDTLGHDGYIHRKEIEEFIENAKKDSIKVHGMSYQELIMWLGENYRENHKEYIEYITSRYL